MNELHLFAGAGGGILGGMLLGHTCVCAVEINQYRRKVLLQRQRDGILPRFPIWDDVATFNGAPWRGYVDVVCGGFPCQDISAAGKGAGIRGVQSGLWAEFARIVGEVQPAFVYVENSPVLTLRGIDVVLGDLAALGYDAQWGVIGAIHAGAPHRRLRIWIVANSRYGSGRNERIAERGEGLSGERTADSDPPCRSSEQSEIMADTESVNGGLQLPAGDEKTSTESYRRSEDMADTHSIDGRAGAGRGNWQKARDDGETVPDTDRAELEEQRRTIPDGEEYRTIGRGSLWESEPDLGRVAHGVAHRVDRLEAIGDGQVPAVAALAWRTLIQEAQ